LHIIEARNVHEAFPKALALLNRHGIERDSRNGRVLQVPGGVTTVYQQPTERVLFYPDRDANPFFHLYESLWMLAGRQDIAPLTLYAKQMSQYSDDGTTQRGAYGYRWRNWFRVDQLPLIMEMLDRNHDERRAVLQMWDANCDLGRNYKDVPCNLTATFQIDHNGRLNLTVFCRSNDIIWGAYGANAVHFSMLLEYMALAINCPVGTYTQVSVNWHGYLETIKKSMSIIENLHTLDGPTFHSPYRLKQVRHLRMYHSSVENFDKQLEELLLVVNNSTMQRSLSSFDNEPFLQMAYEVLCSHERYRFWKDQNKTLAESAELALSSLRQSADQTVDWVVAAREWFERRIK
jgi:thymidylate synthase